MTIALNALRDEWVGRVSSSPYLDGEMLLTPWDFPDGRTLDLYVQQMSDDWYFVSDRGLVADRLSDAGVDVSRGAGARSWEMLRRGLSVVLADAGRYEIAGTAVRSDLGGVINDVAVRALQGDALRVLGRTRRNQGFAERAMKEAVSFDLGVLPDSTLSNRFGGTRKVTFSAEGAGGKCFVMALGRSDSFIEDHDRAKLAFEDAEVDRFEKACLIGSLARPLPWHIKSLEDVSEVYGEQEQNRLWGKLAAAA